MLNNIKKNDKEFYDVIRGKAAIKDRWKRERLQNMQETPMRLKSSKKRREFSLGLRALEAIPQEHSNAIPAKKPVSKRTSQPESLLQIETIRGSSHSKMPSASLRFYESFQAEHPSIKVKKLTMELISHIVRKNAKIAKKSLNPQLITEKNSLFEYFRSNKYQENYLKAKLFNARAPKTQDIGVVSKSPNYFLSGETLTMLKRLKSKNNSQTEESMENFMGGDAKKRAVNTNTINPYQLASKLDGENEPGDLTQNSQSVSSGGNFGSGCGIMSSKHNMFRVKPKNFYVMKNYYKL